MSTPFAWEEAYKRTWEETKTTSKTIEHKDTRTSRDYKPFRRGLIRHFHVVVDQSEKIDGDGYIPSFRYNIIQALDAFIPRFYQENPVSVLSILSARDSGAREYAVVDGGFSIKGFLGKLGSGYFSLQRALEASIVHLGKSSYLREILVITPSITIRDSSNLQDVFEQLKALNIKTHCINLCGEMHILRSMTVVTNGIHYVPTSCDHFKHILSELCIPKRTSSIQRVSLLKLGFPPVVSEWTLCACHLGITESGYICVKCSTKVCKLPTRCPICDTLLVSLVNLYKSMYHQYPLGEFARNDTLKCRVCARKSFSMCNKCKVAFCFECDAFLHEIVGLCPFCWDSGSNTT